MVVLLAVAPPMACGGVYIFRVNKAIHGYDPVAYFTEGKPVRVENDYSMKWNGATWLFAGTANRKKFKEPSKKFMPQYGGYCGWAASLGYTASNVSDAWNIFDGRLYMFELACV